MSAPQTFRKKPVEIQAMRWDGDLATARALADWGVPLATTTSTRGELYIETLEGQMRAERDDWIIRGVKGEFYPCKPDIFDATYEPVAEVSA